MKTLISIAALAAATCAVATPAAAQQRSGYSNQQSEDARFQEAQRRFDSEYRTFQAAIERYQQSRPRAGDYGPPRGGPGGYNSSYDPRDEEVYDASRDYRDGPSYRERVLTQDERIYRGNDGKYYCKRSDGTTGLVVGAAAGGLFGNVVAGGRSKTVGTILGAIAGGAIGSSVDRNQNQVRCR